MPSRFFCETLPNPASVGLSVALPADEARHARRVLRLEQGCTVELFDGSGVLARGRLQHDGRDGASCVITAVEHPPMLQPLLTVATAMPKGPRADAMVNDLAQLGVDEFIPLRTRRSVVDPRDRKLDRLERAAIAAAKQSGRLTLMRVRPTQTLDELLEVSAAASHQITVLLDPQEENRERGETVASQLRDASRVTLLIGPEGGWSDEERHQCREAGASAWRIHPNVLRVETAALAAAALVRYLTSES